MKETRTTTDASRRQFNPVHDLVIANDGRVYVADRNNNRIQVFSLDGTFVKEAFVARETSTTNGTVYSFAFSNDPQQQFLYVADAGNGRIRILNRETLEAVGAIGRWGRQAGQFMVPHSIGTDSRGNLYVAEIREGRVCRNSSGRLEPHRAVAGHEPIRPPVPESAQRPVVRVAWP